MAVEMLLTGTAAATAAVAPGLLIRGFRMNGASAFGFSVLAAIVVSEIVFRLLKPEFHYGPLYGLGIIMNLLLAALIAAISSAIFSRASK